MNIGNITPNNFNLNGVGKDMQIEVYEQLIGQLQQENKQLKDNWDKLREWLESNWKESQDIWFVKIINKMHELEGSDSNVKE